MSTTHNAGELEIARYIANATKLEAGHAYSPDQEHDACGVGLVAAIDGQPRREVVTRAIEALKSVWHRGAVDADGKTGDGAGIHLQVPQDFFRAHIAHSGRELKAAPSAWARYSCRERITTRRRPAAPSSNPKS
jgi:glutamate synthase (NADPH/NADH) large chain